MANGWLEDREQEFFYIGIRAFFAGDYVEK